MGFEVIVPQMGESVLEGTIVEWKVSEGHRVTVNQPLVEIMTDKINIEIPAEVDGVIEKILAKPGDVIPVGALICIIATKGEKPKATPSAKKEKPAEVKKAATPAAAPVTKKAAPAAPGSVPKMVPAVRKLVRDFGIDPATITATGPDGRITRDDVKRAAAARSDVAQAAPVTEVKPSAATGPKMAAYAPTATISGDMVEERIPLEGPRKMISDHMTRSLQTSAHVTTFEDCDFTDLSHHRNRLKDQFFATYGVKLTYMPFIIKAAIESLKEFPELNASMTESEIILKKYYNIGIAVARENGLIVPVVHNADHKSIIDLAIEINDLGRRARDEKLKLDEVQGGTFTLTNAGMFGATASTPIINQPQVAILGIHKIGEKPAVHEGQIVIRQMSTFSLSFDHRLIDGHTAVKFLHRLIEYIQDLNLLLLRLR